MNYKTCIPTDRGTQIWPSTNWKML